MFAVLTSAVAVVVSAVAFVATYRMGLLLRRSLRRELVLDAGLHRIGAALYESPPDEIAYEARRAFAEASAAMQVELALQRQTSPWRRMPLS